MAAHKSLTVLLAVRDGAQTVSRPIKDLLAGMDEGDELLAIDDGSTDGTDVVLRSHAVGDARVRVITTPGLGLVGALNLGLREATHRWIARADADDRYPPDRLPMQRAVIADGIVLVTADYRVMSGDQPLGAIPCALTHPFVVASLIHPQRIPHPGVLYDKEAVVASGGYRQEDFPAEDLALWLRLVHQGSFLGVPAVSVDWTMAHGSITHSNQGSQRSKTEAMLHSNLPLALLEGVTPADVARELSAYEGTHLEQQRRVLLARDLHSLARLGVVDSAFRESLRALARHPIGTVSATMEIARGKRRRDRARASFKT